VIRAVLFDVDFTLARPGPELGPEGYRRAGERHGLVLDPDRYEAARLEALGSLRRHPELEHDDELWIVFTEAIVRGMGGDAAGARACAEDLVRAWELHERFTLYEDALPALATLREQGMKIGLVSNGSRDLDEFVVHHALDVDCAVGSRAFGRTKPHPEIFRRALALLDAEPEDAAMVGDSYEDDIEGARALGMRAFLLDRDGSYPDEPDRLPDLFALPAALGLNLAPEETTVRSPEEARDEGGGR
jgi:putative hydrolase of the HAD superfamily